MLLDEQIYGMTTIIKTKTNGNFSWGTGFFFHMCSERGEGEFAWTNINSTWLVTNRHVILAKDEKENEIIPENITFYLRENINGNIEWFPIVLDKAELMNRTRLHHNAIVDIVCIDIKDYLDVMNNGHNMLTYGQAASKTDGSALPYSGVPSTYLPEYSQEKFEITDDIIVVGYPRIFLMKKINILLLSQALSLLSGNLILMENQSF